MTGKRKKTTQATGRPSQKGNRKRRRLQRLPPETPPSTDEEEEEEMVEEEQEEVPAVATDEEDALEDDEEDYEKSPEAASPWAYDQAPAPAPVTWSAVPAACDVVGAVAFVPMACYGGAYLPFGAGMPQGTADDALGSSGAPLEPA